MMFSLLRWVVTFIGFSVVLVAAVLNRETLAFTWFPGEAVVRIPVAALILAGAALGYFWGSVMAWIGGASLRAARRDLEREVKELRAQAAAGLAGSAAGPSGMSRDLSTEDILGLLPAKKKWWKVWG